MVGGQSGGDFLFQSLGCTFRLGGGVDTGDSDMRGRDLGEGGRRRGEKEERVTVFLRGRGGGGGGSRGGWGAVCAGFNSSNFKFVFDLRMNGG